MAARKRPAPVIPAFDVPIPSPDERRASGKERRTAVSRSAHAVWEPPSDRRDPVEVLVESNQGRVAELVPLRYSRMSVSPFTFLRGSAQVMAFDLASGPSTDLVVELCGDAHLSNFGAFASPERRLMFDLNDFDEASPGPFEWDVKRLAASIVVAGRDNGFDASASRRAVIDAVGAYCDWMGRYAEMTHLEVWYSRIEMKDLLESMASQMNKVTSAQRAQATKIVAKAQGKDHMKALNKLTTMVDGRRRINDDPPILTHLGLDGADVAERLLRVFGAYRETLSADRRELFDRYRFVDFARKVVGVGSVGTRCWVALFQGPNGGPLFLQVKEARQSVVSVARGSTPSSHFGQRVVEGQRKLQAASDIMLGWATDELATEVESGRVDYYVRQMWDAKWSADIASMGPFTFAMYAGHCGWALARAHARTGDSVAISGYLGTSDRFGEAVADWAMAYADQTERDHAALVSAIESGVLPVA